MRIRLTLMALACTACGPDRPAGEHPLVRQAEGALVVASSPEEQTYAPDLGVDIAAMRKLPSGLLVQDVEPGVGDTLAPGMWASVRYVGSLPDGTEFDSNLLGTPFRFRLGGGAVIPAWDQGLVGMRQGGKRRLVVPHELGYGEIGSGPIPPYATLVFLVELVRMEQ